MANSSLLDNDEMIPDEPPGHDTGALGPGDSSDSGSDIIGTALADSDTDRYGTGERASVEPDEVEPDGSDIAPDHIAEGQEIGVTGRSDT
jgi:hypothetical protein